MKKRSWIATVSATVIAAVIATVAAALLVSSPLHAKTYSCTVTPDGSRDWVSKTLVFNIDDNSGAIRVFDGVIEKYQNQPIAGKLSIQTAKRLTVKWETRRVKDDYGNTAARFFFRATYYKDNGKVIISSIPGGWDNRFGGRGRCTISSDRNWGAAVKHAKGAGFTARGKTRFFSAGDWDILLP